MTFVTSIWDVFWFYFWIFAYIAYLFVLVYIIIDVFRDHTLNGWLKAVWILFLVFVPWITALVYLIARGKGMAERSQSRRPQIVEYSDEEVRSVSFAEPGRRDLEGSGAPRPGGHQRRRVRGAQGEGARQQVLRRHVRAVAPAAASAPTRARRRSGGRA